MLLEPAILKAQSVKPLNRRTARWLERFWTHARTWLYAKLAGDEQK